MPKDSPRPGCDFYNYILNTLSSQWNWSINEPVETNVESSDVFQDLYFTSAKQARVQAMQCKGARLM